MYLFTALAILSLLAVIDSQSCPRITASNLGDTSFASSTGLIAERLGLDLDVPPTIQLLRFNIVCEVTAGSVGNYRHVSLVAEYNINGVLQASQFDFSCINAGGQSVWDIQPSGSPDNTVTTPPNANFNTPTRRDCFLCLGPMRPGSIGDMINHCTACDCVGLGQCTSAFSFTCCNYYQNGICTESCLSPTVPLQDNTCGCPPGFTGTSCDVTVNFCDSGPCMNSGTCSSSSNGFSCSCPPDYTGAMCETLVDPCDNTPCLNGGTCMRMSRTEFTCTCLEGYDGTTCLDINECAAIPNPCLNGGTCQNTMGSYVCMCQGNWGGINCGSCGIGNCTTCSGDGTACTQCDIGFVTNAQNMCSATSVSTQCVQDQQCNNGICVQGNCLCDAGFVNPPNCVALCNLVNCVQCTSGGAPCQQCGSGFIVDSNGLCVRGISRDINLSDPEIIAIVVDGLIGCILLVLLVVCCLACTCKYICYNEPAYVTRKSTPMKKPKKKHIVKRRTKTTQQTTMINNDALNMEMGMEDGEKEGGDITKF